MALYEGQVAFYRSSRMTNRTQNGSFDDLYGLELGIVTDAEARGHLQVCDKVRQPFGLVHGGVYASIAEALATGGTIAGLELGQTAVGLSNYTSFLRPVHDGSLHAVASPQHRGRTTWIWEVQIHDDWDRLCALTRMTVAVRPAHRAAS